MPLSDLAGIDWEEIARRQEAQQTVALPFEEESAFTRQRDALDYGYETSLNKLTQQLEQTNLDERIGYRNLAAGMRPASVLAPRRYAHRLCLSSPN